MRHLSLLLVAFTLVATAGNAAENDEKSTLTDHPFAGLELRPIGPAITSGRISDFAFHPERKQEYYVATASGNVWKTTNAGTTWKSLFDGQPSYSIGDVTIDPSNPMIVWVGTGENVSGRHVGWGGARRARTAGNATVAAVEGEREEGAARLRGEPIGERRDRHGEVWRAQ